MLTPDGWVGVALRGALIMRVLSVLCGAAALCLTSCASGQIGTLPTVTPTTEATVHVFRQSNLMGMLNTFRIAFDKKNLFNIGNGTFVTFPVPAGQHDIAVKCFGGMLPVVQTEDLQQNFAAGQEYYFAVAPDVITCASIQLYPNDEGPSMMAGLTPIKLGN
jgi:hypothetical protein